MSICSDLGQCAYHVADPDNQGPGCPYWADCFASLDAMRNPDDDTEEDDDLIYSSVADVITRDRKGYSYAWKGWTTSEEGRRIAQLVMERLESARSASPDAMRHPDDDMEEA